MDYKKILFATLVFSLLIGSACAAGVNDFKIDKDYKNIYSGDYYSVYSNKDNNTGILVFKNVDDDKYDDTENDDILDNIIHHDGREYLEHDDDLSININPDHTANFTDKEHSTQGVSEVIKVDGKEYIVVAWATNSAKVDMDKLASMIGDFNKDNKVKAIEF